VQSGFGYSAIKNFNAAGAPIGAVEQNLVQPDPKNSDRCWKAGTAQPRQLLQAAEAAQLTIRLGLTVSTIRQMPEAAEVEFNNGTTDRFDLVVGADGAHSKVRALLFGPDVAPQVTGQTIWRATVERPQYVDALWQFFGPSAIARPSSAGE